MWKEFDDYKSLLILDLASGTGDSSKGLLERGFKVVGLDLSQKMLKRAITKLRHTDYIAVVGSGYEIPFKDSSFDGITCAFGIRNMPDTLRAFKEIIRVLKSGGKVVFLEFSMPTGFILPVYRYYLKNLMPRIASIFSSKEAYLYLADSIEGFHTREIFCNLLSQSGFQSCKFKTLTFGTVTLYSAIKP